jgi:hypothetical protein
LTDRIFGCVAGFLSKGRAMYNLANPSEHRPARRIFSLEKLVFRAF